MKTKIRYRSSGLKATHNYKEPQTLTVSWESAAAWLKRGYKIQSLQKKGGRVYAELKKEEK